MEIHGCVFNSFLLDGGLRRADHSSESYLNAIPWSQWALENISSISNKHCLCCTQPKDQLRALMKSAGIPSRMWTFSPSWWSQTAAARKLNLHPMEASHPAWGDAECLRAAGVTFRNMDRGYLALFSHTEHWSISLQETEWAKYTT